MKAERRRPKRIGSTETAPRRPLQRLVRLKPSLLEIRGIVCGIQKSSEREPCGGRLLVEDWHPKGVRGWLRYEIYCERCGICDPNGWARQDEILKGCTRTFSA